MRFPFQAIRTEDRATTRGFTLIELLVVIGILAILSALLLSRLGTFRESASAAKCVSNERQIILAMLAYAVDNENRLPPYVDTAYCFDVINPYLNVPEGKRIGVDFLECPSAQHGYSYGLNYGPTAWGMGVFGYPESDGREAYRGSLRLSEIRNSTMIIGDASQAIIYNPENWGLHGADFVELRHKGGFNCAFIDGSVRWVPKEEWYVENSHLWKQPK